MLKVFDEKNAYLLVMYKLGWEFVSFEAFDVLEDIQYSAFFTH